MKRLAVLGATGSVGTTALNAVRTGKLKAEIVSLLSGSTPLDDLKDEFHVPVLQAAGMTDDQVSSFLASSSPDIVLNAVSGIAGLRYTLLALNLGCDVALANKESLVLGGSLVMNTAREKGCAITPVDSEHSAIHSLMRGRKPRRLIITASGGPFLDRTDLENVTPEEALAHPVWKMGPKITIDSATLANKGQEVIEASVLFSFPPEDISVTIHRESVIHSMIEMEDGAVYALLSSPDMTLPVVSAITGTDSGKDTVRRLSFDDMNLSFRRPDTSRFPMLSLAYDALREKGSYAIAYASADEVLVKAFLAGSIGFLDIPRITSEVMEGDWSKNPGSYEEIEETAARAAARAEELC